MNPLLVLVLVVVVVASVAGFIMAIVKISDNEPKVLGKRDEELYHSAAKIMSRMKNLQGLPSEEDGIDILSAKTDKQVSQWLADYRKERDHK